MCNRDINISKNNYSKRPHIAISRENWMLCEIQSAGQYSSRDYLTSGNSLDCFFAHILFCFYSVISHFVRASFLFLERNSQRSCECIAHVKCTEKKSARHMVLVHLNLKQQNSEQRKLYKWSVCARMHTSIPVGKEMLGRPFDFVICILWMLKYTTIHCAYLRFFACAASKTVYESKERNREKKLICDIQRLVFF